MTNEDFRKLLMTPSLHTVRAQTAPQTVRGGNNSAKKFVLFFEKFCQ